MLDWKIRLKIWFWKKGYFFLTKFHFYIKHSMEISGKGCLHFHQQASSLIGYQTNHRTSMFLPYYSNSCYESAYECICIVINGKIRFIMFKPQAKNILTSEFREFMSPATLSLTLNIWAIYRRSIHKIQYLLTLTAKITKFILLKNDKNILRIISKQYAHLQTMT